MDTDGHRFPAQEGRLTRLVDVRNARRLEFDRAQFELDCYLGALQVDLERSRALELGETPRANTRHVMPAQLREDIRERNHAAQRRD
jgi:hypothetical protein